MDEGVRDCDTGMEALLMSADVGFSARHPAASCGEERPRPPLLHAAVVQNSTLRRPIVTKPGSGCLQTTLNRANSLLAIAMPDLNPVEKALSGRGVTLMLLWEEWRETHPDGMSYPPGAAGSEHGDQAGT